MSADRWLPLESNPDVMNKFVHKLGMPKEWGFTDIYSLELLDMVPKPVAAVLILFPVNQKYEESSKEEQEKIDKEGQEVSKNLMFIKQTIGNACGTIALLHSIVNNSDKIQLSGYLSNFIEKTKDMTPEERASYLKEDEGLSSAHEESAQEGQTEPPPREEHTELHFLALIAKDGHIYEMDGRRQYPVNHGPTTDDSFLQDAAAVCMKFMNRDPTELRFTLIALSKLSDS
ncbi:ubiquitin carboxyl-terminal hydrolase isozyme L3-like isoform X1 [Anneissia japonica]|uniref:ubiquitin carboxyl-terminal hydrolase isozyme L3-like isoform X1 n=1 Tax=Anneissia japonica TaxID=1529436 RepID=UPI001425A689|nr:ubiquitin carboxyl-terminal hydrolase isozyme L3-like isoform X1 [Anneissia japonica]